MALALAPNCVPSCSMCWRPRTALRSAPTPNSAAMSSAGGAILPTGETACFLLAGDSSRSASTRCSAWPRSSAWRKATCCMRGRCRHRTPRCRACCRRCWCRRPPSWPRRCPARRCRRWPSAARWPPACTPACDWDDLVLPADDAGPDRGDRAGCSPRPAPAARLGHGREAAARLPRLFHGPPGTGKTLTACLLGKRCGRDVYRVDLSHGGVEVHRRDREEPRAACSTAAEHERLDPVLRRGRRAVRQAHRASSDAHDRYANQEVGYLLQRIEDFDGVVILASNLRRNIDEAFLRRFQSVVQFPDAPARRAPAPVARRHPGRACTLEPALDLARLARNHELSGGTIVNVLRYACLALAGARRRRAARRGRRRGHPARAPEGGARAVGARSTPPCPAPPRPPAWCCAHPRCAARSDPGAGARRAGRASCCLGARLAALRAGRARGRARRAARRLDAGGRRGTAGAALRPGAFTAAAAGQPNCRRRWASAPRLGQPLPRAPAARHGAALRRRLRRARPHRRALRPALSRRLSAAAFTVGNTSSSARPSSGPTARDGRRADRPRADPHHPAGRRRAAAAAQRSVDATVRERSAPQVQRLGISDALDYFADKANIIPGFRHVHDRARRQPDQHERGRPQRGQHPARAGRVHPRRRADHPGARQLRRLRARSAPGSSSRSRRSA